jgi:hypothetical protein
MESNEETEACETIVALHAQLDEMMARAPRRVSALLQLENRMTLLYTMFGLLDDTLRSLPSLQPATVAACEALNECLERVEVVITDAWRSDEVRTDAVDTLFSIWRREHRSESPPQDPVLFSVHGRRLSGVFLAAAYTHRSGTRGDDRHFLGFGEHHWAVLAPRWVYDTFLRAAQLQLSDMLQQPGAATPCEDSADAAAAAALWAPEHHDSPYEDLAAAYGAVCKV